MATKKTSKNAPSKADFIRSQPLDMPAKEVVAKAAEAKITLSEAHVHVVRSADKTKAKKKNNASKSAPTPTKTSAKKSSRKRGRKSKKKGVVLKLLAENPTWSAEQIAKAAGASTAYVYGLKRENKGGPAKTATVTRAKTPMANTSASTMEFYRVLKRVGVDEAKQLIANIEAYERA
jgi:hypothetical protein